MRILVVHNRYRSSAPSGENRVVDQETEALVAAGHDVRRLEYRSDDIETWRLWQRASLPARVVWNPRAHTDVAAALGSARPDVVHVHNLFPLLSPSVLHACAAARVPVVATLHNYKLLCASGDFFRDGAVCHSCADGSAAPALAHGCYRQSRAATVPVVLSSVANRRAWRRLVSAYVFLTEAQRTLLAGLRLDPSRTFVKHNLVPPVAYRPTGRSGTVVYAGRLDDAKGVPLLMRAWDEYLSTTDAEPMRLRVVGGGPLAAEVERWASTRRSVEVVGMVDRKECLEILSEARATILSSTWEETFGLVAVEAMAVGTPPIAPAHGSFPELIGDRETGALFRTGDATDLARVLHDVAVRPDRYAEYGRAARRDYERRFEPKRNVEELVSIYRFAVRSPAVP